MTELRHRIEREIRERGPIPFSRYMEMCLYDEEFGYYSRHAEQFGKAGDFYTSSDVHAVFGRLLARQFEEMWRVLDRPESIRIRELGPGRGLFARDVLDWLAKKFPDFFQAVRYELVERSSTLRSKVASTLERYFESGKAKFAQLENDSPTSLGKAPLVVFANEFFDAIPVGVVSSEGSLRVGTSDGRLVETWAPTSPEELEFLDRYSVQPEEGERLEVSLAAQLSLADVLKPIESGFFVAIDYGYTRREQLAGRHRGTLKAIRRHAVSASPYEAPGEQDITADVNFTALAATAESLGWTTHKLLTQSQFLLGIGQANEFADAFEDCRLPRERAKVALQLKHLVTPAGMGESFHVLVASKGTPIERASSLSGLSFGKKIGG